MRAHRPQDAASNPRGHRFGAGVVRVLSVTAVAAMASTMWAGVASAATKHATTTTISASAAPHWVGAVVKLSATVKGSGRVPTGTVTFKRGTLKLCTGRLSGGKTSCNARFGGAGTKAVRGYYSGNATHKASTSRTLNVAVRRSATTTKITNVSAGTVDVGKKYTFHVTVSTPAGTPAASGKVKLVASALVFGPPPTAAYSCTATVTAGKGSCTTGALPNYGIYGYVATYTGNAAHTASATSRTSPFELDVQNVTGTTIAATTPTAGAVTLTAFVDAGGANITAAVGGTGTVTFKEGTTAAGMAAVTGCTNMPLTTFTAATGNSVTCTGNTELNALTAGSYYIEAVFSGDVVNTASNSGAPAAPNLVIG
jgi:Bacterial Ig-like domain (group 3)